MTFGLLLSGKHLLRSRSVDVDTHLHLVPFGRFLNSSLGFLHKRLVPVEIVIGVFLASTEFQRYFSNVVYSNTL